MWMRRENWGEFFHEILSVAKAAVDACKADECDFVEAAKALHAQVTDVFGGDFSFVVIKYMDFDLYGHLLDVFGFDFAFPARLREATFDLGTAKVLAGTIPFTDLKKPFNTFIGRETPLAMVTVASAANGSAVFDVT